LIKIVTASRRLVVALAAFTLLAPLAPSVGAAPELGSGGATSVAPGSGELLRVEPGYGAEVAGEVAPGAPIGIISGPHYDSEGLEWFQVDAGGYLPGWALTFNAYEETAAEPSYEEVAQETYEEPVYDETVAEPIYDASYEETVYEEPIEETYDASYDEAAEPVYEAPVEETYEEAVYEETIYEAPVAEAVAEEAVYEAPVEETYEEAVAEPVYDDSSAAPSYDPGNVISTAWIAGTNGEGVTCRTDASFDGGEIATLWDGQQVGVLGDVSGEWQPVNCGGQAGFIHASFLTWEQPATVTDNASGSSGQDSRGQVWSEEPATSTEAEQRSRRNRGSGRGSAGNDGTSSGSATSANGQAMVDFAMQYVGYPYVYAGEGPHAFDCSGFTMYVAREVLGMNITHDMFTQVGMGTSVSRNQLQPGDLVFFQNTFRDGLSHSGIYIGNGKFVHAENESTGVVVSEVNSDYYGSRWYGATRLA
jgi:cell wall-associated NlpC family hydrolase